jgi:hypothetical protein
MSSAKKLEEAQFFLELLDVLDQRFHPLTNSEDKAKEASYLFAAVLNSFYSCTRIMRDEEGIDIKAFEKLHPEIYARSEKGGERNKTVHVRHTEASPCSTWTKGTDFILEKPRVTPFLINEARVQGRVDFVLVPKHHIFIELRGKLEPVTKFCYEHYYQLRDFHAKTMASRKP